MYNGQLIKSVVFDCAFILTNTLLVVFLALCPESKIVNISVLCLVFLFYLIFAFIPANRARKLGNTFVPKKFNAWYYYVIYAIGVSLILYYPVNTFIQTNVVHSYKVPTGAMEKSILIGDFLLADHMAYQGNRIPSQGDIVVFKFFGLQEKNYIKRIIGISGQKITMIGKTVYVNDVKQENPPGSQYIRNGLSPDFPDTFSVTIPAPNDKIVVNALQYRDFLFLYHIAKQENARVEGNIQIFQNGQFLNSIPFAKVDNWTALKQYFAALGSGADSIRINNLLKIDGKIVSEYTIKNDNFFVLGDNRDNSVDSRHYGYVNKKNIQGKAKMLYLSIDLNESIIHFFKWIRWNRIGMKVL